MVNVKSPPFSQLIDFVFYWYFLCSICKFNKTDIFVRWVGWTMQGYTTLNKNREYYWLQFQIFRIKPIAYIFTILSNIDPPAAICDEIKILYSSLVILKVSGIAILLLSWDSSRVVPSILRQSLRAARDGGLRAPLIKDIFDFYYS